MQMNPNSLTIRVSREEDERPLLRLAALDSKPAPSGPSLLAEVGNELWAAVSLRDGRTLADPFRPSGEVLDLLRIRAATA
jgi:hypothetical protein